MSNDMHFFSASPEFVYGPTKPVRKPGPVPKNYYDTVYVKEFAHSDEFKLNDRQGGDEHV